LQEFLDENPDLREEYADLGLFSLLSDNFSTFPSKSSLKKDLSQISSDQFDLLAVSKLENDITPDGEAELNELLATDPARRISYELIIKTRLKPGKMVFPGKHRLKHPEGRTRTLSLAYKIMGAAASLLLLFSLYRLILVNEPSPSSPSEIAAANGIKSPENVSEIAATSPKAEKQLTMADPVKEGEKESVSEGSVNTYDTRSASGEADFRTRDVTNVTIPEVGSMRETPAGAFPRRINLENRIGISGQQMHAALAVSRIEIPDYNQDEDRSTIGRFIARNFREKILKEETPEESPLKAYEIAEAGVSGINKLLGWEMAISRNTNETGDVSSVYFSSRLLKVNAPVRSERPLP
jgi:hypothetical protein